MNAKHKHIYNIFTISDETQTHHKNRVVTDFTADKTLL